MSCVMWIAMDEMWMWKNVAFINWVVMNIYGECKKVLEYWEL